MWYDNKRKVKKSEDRDIVLVRIEVIKEIWKLGFIPGKVSFAHDVGLQAHGFADSSLCPYFQVAKAHFGDFAGMAEKAPDPHFPYFIYGPLESSVCKCHLWEMRWRTREMCLCPGFCKSLRCSTVQLKVNHDHFHGNRLGLNKYNFNWSQLDLITLKISILDVMMHK